MKKTYIQPQSETTRWSIESVILGVSILDQANHEHADEGASQL